MHTPFSVSRLVWRLGLLVSLFALLIGFAGVAHADPVDQATNAVNGAADLVKLYGPIWGGMALLYALISRGLAEAQSKHWIAQGRALAAILAGLGIFAAVLQGHFSGQWNGVIATIGMAVFKLINPNGPATTTPTPAPASSQRGNVRRGLIVSMAFLAIAGVASCAWLGSSGKAKAIAGGNAAAACVVGDLEKYAPDFFKALESADYAGGIAKIAADNNLSQDAINCIIKTLVAVWTAATPAGSASTSQPSVAVIHAKAYLADHGGGGS